MRSSWLLAAIPVAFLTACSTFSEDLDRWAKTASADALLIAESKLAVAEAAAVDTKPTGIAPETLEKCLKRKAKTTPKGGVPPKGDKSADGLVLTELETKRLRESCVWLVIRQHQGQQAKQAKK